MLVFLIKKTSLTFRISLPILLEVTLYIIFLALTYWILRDDPISVTFLVLIWTVPVLSFFYLSSVRLGLMALNICGPINTSFLISTVFKGTIYIWGLGIVAMALSLLIWYPIIHALVPNIDVTALISANLGDVLQQGLGSISFGKGLPNAPLAYGILLPIFMVISVILQIIFTIPLSSLAASMDGKSSFDPITGVGSYFWSIILTLSVGYIILLILLINIVFGTSIIFDISMSPIALINEHGPIFFGAAVFFTVIFPISYLAALHTSVSAKAYKRYFNKLHDEKIVYLGILFKPKPIPKPIDTLHPGSSDASVLQAIRRDWSR